MLRPGYMLMLLLLCGCARAQNDQRQLAATAADSVIFPASTRYTRASFFTKVFTGKNYRKEWSTPVKMPVLDLNKTGLEIVKMGGGMQTKSLRLVDRQGREWALRSVDKFAEGAVPPGLRNTIAENVVQQMISAGYPYAAITVGVLADAVGVTAPNPVLYFVPDADFLGDYRTDFANTVCFLEKREPNPHTLETGEFILKKIDNHENGILQKEILKARLLDMLVADWDRHEGQWLWAPSDTSGSRLYYPVPLDRDQAFFLSDGLLARIAKLVAMPHINGFKKESKKLKKLSYKSWEFDRFFLNDLDASDWRSVILEFQSALNDQLIDSAVKKMPPEIYAISGPKISSILKSRNRGLLENAMKYYEFLSASAQIIGTNENEVFRVSGNKEAVVITVYQLEGGIEKNKIYERRFLPSETKQIEIYGLDGDDQFIVEESARKAVRLKIHRNQD